MLNYEVHAIKIGKYDTLGQN